MPALQILLKLVYVGLETFETFINTPVLSGEFDDSHYSQSEDGQCINNHAILYNSFWLQEFHHKFALKMQKQYNYALYYAAINS